MEKSKYKYVFGPVPSRRLGRSLGVDLVPFKECTFDCLYCQLGRTPHTAMDRVAFVEPEDVVREVKEKISGSDLPDYITLSGSGEPTLCKGLDLVIHGIKEITDIPVAVLTNGSLLWDKKVRCQLINADLVIPSLDAGDEEIFKKMNRPCDGISFEQVLRGLIDFREEYAGKLWLEVFLLEGINSSDSDIRKISAGARKIKPDLVQLNTVARPPAESFAQAVSLERMEEVVGFFGVPVEIIADYSHVHEKEEFKAGRDEMLELLKRRPCSVEGIAEGLSIHRNGVVKYVGELVGEGKIEAISQNGEIFYKATLE
jgi:wyosine [tRNA(Phe)-imidazoG37] synthetase (radical SAM superfamily)